VLPSKLALARTTTLSSTLAAWNKGLDDKVLSMCSLTRLQLAVDIPEWPKKGGLGPSVDPTSVRDLMMPICQLCPSTSMAFRAR